MYITTGDGVRLFVEKAGSDSQAIVIPNAIYMFDDFKHLADRRTVIAFDLRNRGRSDSIADAEKLARGIHNDIDDLEAVRRHFGFDRIDLLAHSYSALALILYAHKHPARVRAVIAIAPLPPFSGTWYASLEAAPDPVLQQVGAELGELEKQRGAINPVDFCRRWWAIARAIYVADPADASKIEHWGFCDWPNERNFLKYWAGSIVPSIANTSLSPSELARVTAPVLIVHGAQDRVAPYAGSEKWAALLPNARLAPIANAGHVPWLESPAIVRQLVSSVL